MKLEQLSWTTAAGWGDVPGARMGAPAHLVLAFGAPEALEDRDALRLLAERYPGAHVVGCSTAGEISGSRVSDGTIAATAVCFERSSIRLAEVDLAAVGSSFAAGRALGEALARDGLVHVFVVSDGAKVNGSELVKGLTAGVPPKVLVTGGLAGDGARFARTLVAAGGTCREGRVAAVGFYGDALRVGCGSMGGWDSFGPERLVTRAEGNVLYEVDGKSALDLYKRYLGDHAADLPASALLFPLSLRSDRDHAGVVRTILSIDEARQSMTFAGDVPEGAYVRLMKANFERLIDGAHGAAAACHHAIEGSAPDLAILISCVGRKLVLKQRVEEEVESVRGVLGEKTAVTGFYSYGEISPFTPGARCELHNQTMTVTTLSER